jgi:hypothetical protein
VQADRKRTYIASGALTLAAIVCLVLTGTTDLPYVQYMASGFVAAAGAIVAPLIFRKR